MGYVSEPGSGMASFWCSYCVFPLQSWVDFWSSFNDHFLNTGCYSTVINIQHHLIWAASKPPPSPIGGSPHSLWEVVAMATPQPYVEQGGGKKGGALQHYSSDRLWVLRETEKMCVCSGHQNLPLNPWGERDISSSCLRNTNNTRHLSVPSQNTRRLFVVSTSRPKQWKKSCLFHQWRISIHLQWDKALVTDLLHCRENTNVFALAFK